MKDFAIDPNSNRFLTDARGLRFTENRLEYLAQKIRCCLSLFLGEWYLDKTIGIPYIPTELKKALHRQMLEAAIRTKIMSVRGVIKLLSFTPEYDSAKRVLSVSFVAETDAGELALTHVPLGGGV
jgi:hypothetical protein